jgi:hypothetical protein
MTVYLLNNARDFGRMVSDLRRERRGLVDE